MSQTVKIEVTFRNKFTKHSFRPDGPLPKSEPENNPVFSAHSHIHIYTYIHTYTDTYTQDIREEIFN